MKRKIAAILAADVAGYSRLVAEDEEETLRRLSNYRSLFNDVIGAFGGRVFNTAGDAVLAEFPSAVEALRAAINLQESLRARNLAYLESRQLNFRMGLTIGDVVESGTDLLGDGVNIAARLQTLAEPGGICVSEALRDAVAGKLSVNFGDLGLQKVKNIPNPIHAYRVSLGETARSPRGATSASGHMGRVLKIGTFVGVSAAVIVAMVSYLPFDRLYPPSRTVLEPVVDKAGADSLRATAIGDASSSAELGANQGTPVEAKAIDAKDVSVRSDVGPSGGVKDVPSIKNSDAIPNEARSVRETAPEGMATIEAEDAGKENVEASTSHASDAKSIEEAPPSKTVALHDADAAAADSRLMPARWKTCSGEDAAIAVSACRALLRDTTLPDVDQAGARFWLGLALRKQGDATAAIDEFSKSIDLDLKAATLNERGIAYLQNGRVTDAIADFDRAIKLDNTLGDAFNNRAYTLLKIGKWKEALLDAERAIALLPDKAYAWDTRASIQESLGNTQSAIADYKKALSLDSSLESSKSALTRLKGK